MCIISPPSAPPSPRLTTPHDLRHPPPPLSLSLSLSDSGSEARSCRRCKLRIGECVNRGKEGHLTLNAPSAITSSSSSSSSSKSNGSLAFHKAAGSGRAGEAEERRAKRPRGVGGGDGGGVGGSGGSAQGGNAGASHATGYTLRESSTSASSSANNNFDLNEGPAGMGLSAVGTSRRSGPVVVDDTQTPGVFKLEPGE